jgi:hypothetical protein
MSNLYKGHPIDASYQVSVHLAEGFQRRRLKCERLTDDKWWQKLTLPLETILAVIKVCWKTIRKEIHLYNVIFYVRLLGSVTQALVSFKKYMSPPLPYFKVNIYPFPLPHFASIFFAYLWSFRWPNYIVTLPRYFSFRLPHLNIPTGPPSEELDKNSQRTWLNENVSHVYMYTTTGTSTCIKLQALLHV